MEETAFPKWLGQRLLEDDFPWEKALDLKPEAFIKKIILHDSILIKLVLDSAWKNTAILVIQWNTYWNKDHARYPGDEVGIWPILLIQVPKVSNIECVDYGDIGGVQRTISDLETQKVQDYFVSKIMDVYGGKIILSNKGDYKVLCYDIGGQQIQLKKEMV